MNDELAAIVGKYEEHVGRLQGRYRIAKEEAKREVDEVCHPRLDNNGVAPWFAPALKTKPRKKGYLLCHTYFTSLDL
jgi:hypothetical protein